MAGLLDFIGTPEGQGLLSAAFGGLAGARRGQPINGLGRAGLAGLAGFSDATDRQTQQAQLAKRNQLFDLQLAQGQQAFDLQNKKQQLAADSALSPNQVAMNANGGPTVAAGRAAPTTEPGYNFKRYSEGLAALGDVSGALAIQQSLRKEQPKLSKLETMRSDDGRLVNVAVFEDGTTKVLPYGVKPEMVLQLLGNRVEAIDKNAVQGGQSFTMGQSPDSVASNAVTIRGQNMTDARSREAAAATREAAGGVQYREDGSGGFIALPNKPVGAGPIQAIPVSGMTKNTKNATDALALVRQARDLIPSATGSYLGVGVDEAARVFGGSTPGAQASAKLKAIEGALMMKQPRMEGPQGVLDVLLYRQMAGQIGDPTVPNNTKLAALETIQEMQERYSGVAKAPPKPRNPTPGNTLKFDEFGNMVP